MSRVSVSCLQWIGILLFFMTVPSVGLLFPPSREKMIAVESREPASCAFASVDDFTKKASKCLTDRVLGRFELMSWMNWIYDSLGTSPKPEVAVRGTHHWYFLGDFYDAGMSKFRGLPPGALMPNTKEQQFESILRMLEKSGVPYVFSVTPDKPRVYPEFLPDWLVPGSGPSRVDEVLSRFHTKGYVGVSLKDVLVARRQKEDRGPLYLETDSHWNYLGAFEGYKRVLSELHSRFGLSLRGIQDADLTFRQEQGECDLARLLQLSLPCTMMWPVGTNPNVFSPLVAISAGTETPIGPFEYLEESLYLRMTKNDKALNGKKLLFINDSFGRALNPFLRQTFSSTVEIHYESVFDGAATPLAPLLEQYKPDVVLVNAVERIF